MLSRQERFGNGRKKRKEKEESDIHKGRDDEEGHGADSAEKTERLSRNTGEIHHSSGRAKRDTGELNYENGNYDYRNGGYKDRNGREQDYVPNYGSNRTGHRPGAFDYGTGEPSQENEKREYNQKFHQEYTEDELNIKAKNIKRPEKSPVKKPIKKPAGTGVIKTSPEKKKNGYHSSGRNHNTRTYTIRCAERPFYVLGLIALIIVGLVGYLAVDNMMLRKNNEKLSTQLAKATESPDLKVDYGDLRYGSAGKPISPLYPEMVVEWREDPVYTPLTPTVYLTFDDGPSSVTPQILDTLDAYGIKATFFVVGKTDEKLSAYYKEIVDRGHTLAMHSWTHQYNTIYESVDNFLTDYVQLYNLLYEKTGVKPELYRYPGGTTNSYANKKFGTFDTIKKEMDSRGFIYYDWNVSSGDAKGKNVDPEELIQNVVNGVKGKKYAVVLMHDSSTKETTATALPRMIEELAAMGYHFDRLTTDIAPIQFK